MPKVSVIIPCFNLGRYLDEAVGSVLAQTMRDFEIIVVNPGSTDEETNALLADYRRPKTRVVATERKRAGAARNHGISLSSGEYVCCLDPDDLLEPACLEKTGAVMNGDPGVGIVTFWYTFFGDKPGTVDPDSATLADFLVDNRACTASLFRRKAWEEVGGYDETLPGYEDWDFWIGILERGYRAHVLEEFLFRYRIREGGKHHRSNSPEYRGEIMDRIIARHAASFREHALEVIRGKDRLLGEYRLYWRHREEELDWLLGHHDDAHRYIRELETALNRGEPGELRRLLDEREHELRSVYASKAWKVGSAVQRAWRAVKSVFSLPFRR
ncbi:MAG: glycosyltransferase family A protein [bacterium]|nr:glycosyltransferase family A protein [bacterium]